LHNEENCPLKDYDITRTMIVVDKAEYAIMQTIGTGVSCKVKVGLNKATRQRSALKIFDKKFLKVAKEGVI
jgi:hypothetical protein